jgi:hypothetical protein
LGMPLPGESVEELDRLGEEDRVRAEEGLVRVMGKTSKIFYKPLDDLTRHEMWNRIAAERVQVAWLKERLARRRRVTIPPT